jgi:hypothetical protein
MTRVTDEWIEQQLATAFICGSSQVILALKELKAWRDVGGWLRAGVNGEETDYFIRAGERAVEYGLIDGEVE